MGPPTLRCSFTPFGEGANLGTLGAKCQHPIPKARSRPMSDQNKALARRSFEEVWNHGNLAIIKELVAPNATFHDPSVPGGKFTGPEGFRQFVQIYRGAFPDVRITIEDLIAEGD